MNITASEFVMGASRPGDLPHDGKPQIAVAGRSNVGKSSLLNFLCARKKLVRVSKTPGKTREINFFLVNNTFYLADLPGVGWARLPGDEKRRIEELLLAYFTNNRALRCLLYLVDLRVPDSETDHQFLEWLEQFPVSVIPVGTKADQLVRADLHLAARQVRELHAFSLPPILTSVKQGLGRPELLGVIAGQLEAHPALAAASVAGGGR